MLDILLLASSIVLGLIYFSHYVFCHIAMALGVITLLIGIAFGEAFFSCNSIQTINLHELFISLKACLPLKPLIWLYFSTALILMAIIGYARVSLTVGYAYLQKHITSQSSGTD